jgi:hypothetical protein
MFRAFRLCRHLLAAMLAGTVLTAVTGCSMILPDVSHQPVVHNPFPQLSRVAVAPFFNQSDEATVDGRKFALAYYAELQAVPGFEVVPLGVVEEAILEQEIELSRGEEIRRLARILGVDAVIIGTVTDYSPFYPPRCGIRVEWYAANPGFHEIPPGYGLPWGTPEEEFIPAPLVFEAEMALAKAQLATQTPACEVVDEAPLGAQVAPPVSPGTPSDDADGSGEANVGDGAATNDETNPNTAPPDPSGETNDEATEDSAGEESTHEAQTTNETTALYEEELPPGSSSGDASLPALQPAPAAVAATTDAIGASGPHSALPPDWPDERGFIPPPPSPVRPSCCPNAGPIMTHTRIYHGTDSEFTEALASYYHFRDDARFGGWQNYLQRSDDFVRFCCHLHIAEMLSARGGAGETRVVWQWSDSR